MTRGDASRERRQSRKTQERSTGVTNEDRNQASRIGELEQRVEELEHRVVTRDVLDRELRSLEQRLSEVRELTEG